jgi:hypothetical protein
MTRLRREFTIAMGIKWSENPNPTGGYKLEFNPIKRDQYYQQAKKIRDEFEVLVLKYGIKRDILNKMDSNLANRNLRRS